MKVKKLLSILLVLALLCTLFVPCVSADETSREIPFTVSVERRMLGGSFESWVNLELVKDEDRLHQVVEEVRGYDTYYYMEDISFFDKYDSEYFEDNALVVGVFYFFSGSLRHSVEKITVSGDTLVVHRNIYMPAGGTDDVQYRCVFLEVPRSDVEGVNKLEDVTTDVRVSQTMPVYGFRGDAEFDGVVNVRDATALQKHIAQLHILYGAENIVADANADGDVNIKDATEIQKYSAGIKLNSGAGLLMKVLAPVVSEKTQAALTELHHLIAEAKGLFVPGSNYVAATSAKLSEEIEKSEAIFEIDNPALDVVTAQKEALREAMEGLEFVNLDTKELVSLMNTASRYIGTGYTDDSLEALKEAISNAQMVCLYGQSQDEVTLAVAQIEEAVNALEYAFDEDAVKIPFTLVQECRVFGYDGADDTLVYLVKSPAQMDEILATIHGENTAVYTKPERDASYDEAFFEENSLIITLNLAGYDESEQVINALVLKDDVLIVRRELYKIINGNSYKNYRFALMEVKNSDIEGVVTLKNANYIWHVITEPPIE